MIWGIPKTGGLLDQGFTSTSHVFPTPPSRRQQQLDPVTCVGILGGVVGYNGSQVCHSHSNLTIYSKMMEFVNGKDDIPCINMDSHKIHVWNHQMAIVWPYTVDYKLAYNVYKAIGFKKINHRGQCSSMICRWIAALHYIIVYRNQCHLESFFAQSNSNHSTDVAVRSF